MIIYIVTYIQTEPLIIVVAPSPNIILLFFGVEQINKKKKSLSVVSH